MTALPELARLETSGLLRLAAHSPNLEYEFRHSLFQATAYRSLLRQDRKHLHGLVGEALEQTRPGRIEELAPQLADHYSEAGRKDPALEYATLAGSESLRVHAYAEAVDYLEMALQWARTEPIVRDDLKQAYLSLGRAQELAGQFDRALATYEAMRAEGRDLEDQELALSALAAEATLYSTGSPLMDREKGARLSLESLASAQALGDSEGEIRSRWNLLLSFGSRVGQEGDALVHGERALELADEVGEDEMGAYLRNDLGRVHLFCGNFRRSEELIHEAESRWVRRRNDPMRVDCLMTRVWLYQVAGKLSEVPSVVSEARELAAGTGNAWAQAYSAMMIDRYYFEVGEFGRALACASEALERSKEIGFSVGAFLTEISLGMIFREVGETAQALDRTTDAIHELKEQRHPFADQAIGVQAAVHLDRGDLPVAEKSISKVKMDFGKADVDSCFPIASIPLRIVQLDMELEKGRPGRVLERGQKLEGWLEARGIRLYLPEVLMVLGRAHQSRGELGEAVRILDAGLELAEEIGATRMRWHLLLALAKVEDQRGNEVRAGALMAEAAAVIEMLAESLEGHSDLRASFLARQPIRQVLEALP